MFLKKLYLPSGSENSCFKIGFELLFFNTLKVYLYVQYGFFIFLFNVSLLSTKLCCVKTASARTDVLSSVLCSMVTLT